MASYEPVPSGGDDKSGPGGLIAKVCVITAIVVVLVLFGVGPPIAAWQFTKKHHNWDESLFANCKGYPEKTRYCTEGDPLTPKNITRYQAWGGCPAGYKTDKELEACGLPCVSSGMIHAVENFEKTHDYKLVKFPSRKHPGVNTVELTAWWLPCGRKGAPRIALQHGNNANFFSRYAVMASYILRSIGFDVIMHNLRNHGSSGVSEPVTTTWGYDYPFDLLGAWDYAVNDPDGQLGGKRNASQVGIMGFSMGGFIAASALGLEKDVPAAWTDGAVFDLPEEMAAQVRAYIGGFLASMVGKVVGLWLPLFAKVDVYKHEPATTLPKGPPTKRPYMVAYSSKDKFVPIDQSQMLVAFLKKYPEKYKTTVFERDTTCNTNPHCSIEMAMGDAYRRRLCQFWTGVFGLDAASCQLLEQSSLDNGYNKHTAYNKYDKKDTTKDTKEEAKKETKKDTEANNRILL